MTLSLELSIRCWSFHTGLQFSDLVTSLFLWSPSRYVTGILEDARVYSSHARKKALDTEDVKLAVQLAAEQVGFWNYPDLRSSIFCSRVLHRLHPERLFWSWPGLKTQLSFLWYRCNALQRTVPTLTWQKTHNSFSSQKLALGYRLIVIASPPPIINSRPGISRCSGENLISSSDLRHRPSGFDYGGGGGGGLKPQYNRSKPGD